MNFLYKYLWLLSLIILLACKETNNSKAIVVLNEICLSGEHHINPDIGKPTAWLEIKNNSNAPFDLEGTVFNYDDTEYEIESSVKINPNEYQLIYLDGKKWTPGEILKNERIVRALHLPIIPLSKGENLSIKTNEGQLIGSLNFDSIPEGYSLGLVDSLNFQLQPYPTPLQENCRYSCINQKSKNIETNLQNGVFEDSVELRINENASDIYYSRDGSLPTLHSQKWIGPITIKKNSVFVFRRFTKNKLASEPYYLSVFFKDSLTIPKFSIITQPEYLNDSLIGIYCVGSNGIKTNLKPKKANYNNKWNREVVVQYFNKDTLAFTSKMNMKIAGKLNAVLPLKSLKLSVVNKNQPINYPLFDNKYKGNTSYNSFLLRNSGADNKYTLFRDGLASWMTKEWSEVATQFYKPVDLWINGQYYGVINLREKINTSYIKRKENVTKKEFDLLEFFVKLKTENGQPNKFQKLLKRIEEKTISYSEINRKIDIRQFTQYYLTQFYIGNIDWPFNNQTFWKSNQEKWRWILVDCDAGFGFYDEIKKEGKLQEPLDSLMITNPFVFHLDSNKINQGFKEGFRLFNALFNNYQEFRLSFSNSLLIATQTVLSPLKVVRIIDSVQGIIEPSMDYHITNWDSIRTKEQWLNSITFMKEFCFKRRRIINKQISERLQSKLIETQINIASCIPIYLESIPLTASFKGQFMENKPLKISIQSGNYDLLVNGQKTNKKSLIIAPKANGVFNLKTVKKSNLNDLN